MTTKIAKVANIALHVFRAHSLRASATGASYGGPPSSCEEVEITSEALKQLLSSVAALNLCDVGLDSPFTLSLPHRVTAPVIYMHITENEVFSMGMFILRPGSRIPLHGHPGMFGVIRVMQGSMRCRSFTPLRDKLPAHRSTSKWLSSSASNLTVAEPHSDKLLGADDHRPCLLTPRVGNLHELTAVEGTVVFLDILAPPYDHDLGTRECLFYREVDLPSSDHDEKSALSHVQLQNHPRVYLTEINQPRDYWCETLPYHGPQIT
ncbi:unnamed protein product [Mesocestoides corti]|uniref:2-aminoethanethiol dioxygenase n=1 Tax=Mesocestoides corti TaxID=53468 RepID=A0A0R3UFI1_MESCO|nr:unnamed protein product [Mesocestoides corti]